MSRHCLNGRGYLEKIKAKVRGLGLFFFIYLVYSRDQKWITQKQSKCPHPVQVHKTCMLGVVRVVTKQGG